MSRELSIRSDRPPPDRLSGILHEDLDDGAPARDLLPHVAMLLEHFVIDAALRREVVQLGRGDRGTVGVHHRRQDFDHLTHEGRGSAHPRDERFDLRLLGRCNRQPCTRLVGRRNRLRLHLVELIRSQADRARQLRVSLLVPGVVGGCEEIREGARLRVEEGEGRVRRSGGRARGRCRHEASGSWRWRIELEIRADFALESGRANNSNA